MELPQSGGILFPDVGAGQFGTGQGRKKREAKEPSEVGSVQGPKGWERVGDWKRRIRNQILRVH